MDPDFTAYAKKHYDKNVVFVQENTEFTHFLLEHGLWSFITISNTEWVRRKAGDSASPLAAFRFSTNDASSRMAEHFSMSTEVIRTVGVWNGKVNEFAIAALEHKNATGFYKPAYGIIVCDDGVLISDSIMISLVTEPYLDMIESLMTR